MLVTMGEGAGCECLTSLNVSGVWIGKDQGWGGGGEGGK